MRIPVVLLCFIGICFSCSEFTPKPRGYMRIEPGAPYYQQLLLDDLPYTFDVSSLAMVELPPVNDPEGWINIDYPSLNAKIYCSYLSISPQTFPEVERESRRLMEMQVRHTQKIVEREYENVAGEVYGSLFEAEGDSPSPVQFMLTDSLSRFFRGALYYEVRPNADSLAPVTVYLREDIMHLIQSFRWN